MSAERDAVESPMTLVDHLNELRRRVLVCVAALAIGTVVAYIFYPELFYPMLRAPLDMLSGNPDHNPFVINIPFLRALAHAGGLRDEVMAESIPLYYRSLVEPFMMRLKLSIVVGIFLVVPVIAYQIWSFVSAGLYHNERRAVLFYGPFSLVLFLVGAAIGYYLILPTGIIFLIQQGEDIHLHAALMINEYASLVMWLLLGIGLVFQTPLVLLFLTRIGVIDVHSLSKWRRYAILAAVILAAVITPTGDPFSQTALAIPMYGLYELSIWLARFSAWRRRKAQPND